MIAFPNCKINLGLQIKSKRPDGYHNLETIFYPVSIKDVVEIIPSNSFQFTVSGLQINGSDKKNLCVKAYQLLKKDFPQLPQVKMWLHKNIPMGAGLGGGSADGAFALKLLNEKFSLNLTTDQLIGYASQLGSDSPFFIINKPCYATGRGEIMNPIELNLSSYSFVFVHPNIHVNTAWAFSQISVKEKTVDIKKIIAQKVESWRNLLINDFEKLVFKSYPELEAIKKNLYDAGAEYASMTGTGSTIYGLFKSRPANLPAEICTYQTTIL